MKNLKEQINKDFLEAFKSKQMEKKNFLGVIKGDIQNEEGRGVESTDENVLKVLKKMEKSLKENVDKGVVGAKEELEIIKPYLPELMSEEDIRKIVTELVAGGNNNIGLIMRVFNAEYKGKADNKIVKNISEEILN